MKTNHPKFILYSVAALLLAACAQPRPAGKEGWRAQSDIDSFAAEGRLAVKANEKGSYANFDWTYQNQVQTINVNTPLGNTLGQLCQDGQGVLAVDNKGKKYQAASARELSEQLLGFPVPVQYLHIWTNGQWVKNAPYQILPDGRLQQFEWTISRSLNENGTPRILLLESAKLSLRLVFDQMKKTNTTNAPAQCAARS
ncbi:MULTISPECIES: lipoprotein insertase outer membrane protein LolB [Neisseria]|uniref:Outer-membrane lipoprotein LolB n=1 Tax=Neisseria musculi TaxID=1815583 RepID=A0A7H1MDT5_9NEIS|nr:MULTISPECIES: lipoprotein insertase outer membrane protein LolB [Neisseria]MBF0802865.1 outer membrane lipoprotein LolB [Neisseria sp. 19428wB4_WF04]QNT59800.1 outer membrane lipoprotein LolB [Neisseria musculi]TFU44645.1 outer membrane lipoprotein LolB [Neisseria sp. WF04]